MRLAFISTVNFYDAHDQPRQLLVLFKENARRTNPQIPYVFLGKMRLAFNVTLNLHVMRPTVPGFRIFFQGKRVSHQPFQIPCVFSSKMRLEFNVTVKVIWLAADRSNIPDVFQRKHT